MTKDASFKKVVRRHAEETSATPKTTDLEGLGARTTSPLLSGFSPISGIATA